jgi:hypothetical protein
MGAMGRHDGLMFWREHDVCIFRGHGPLLRGTGVTGEERPMGAMGMMV